MSSVKRLDFSKPPRGYRVVDVDGMWWWGRPFEQHLQGKSFADKRVAIAATWADFKSANEPPGLRVESIDHGSAFLVVQMDGQTRHEGGSWSTRARALAAAWALYVKESEVLRAR